MKLLWGLAFALPLAAILEAHAPAGLRWWYEPRQDLEHSTIFRSAVPAAFVMVLH